MSTGTVDTIQMSSLDWAMQHVSNFGDTDIFPVPFEYQALSADWPAARSFLAGIDIGSHSVGGHRIMLLPKPIGGFRVVHQLDPIDSLLYTATVYEAAESIETSRAAPELKVACSYRVDLDTDGRFFCNDSGWSDYTTRSEELSNTHEWALSADISDFYNQISHHRIRNALEISGIPSLRAKNVEGILLQIAARQSRGLPVGPWASIVLAEACLSDVDSHLLRRGHDFTRYVDDFRVFAASEKECFTALHDLTRYLHTSHRLAMQGAKTKIEKSAVFAANDLEDPEALEEEGQVTRLNELIREFWEATGYSVTLDDIPEEDSTAVLRETLREVFQELLSREHLRVGTARHVLHRARALRTRILYPMLLENLETLAPVWRDVCTYLLATMPTKKIGYAPVGDALLDFATNSRVGHLPLMRMWILQVISEKPKILEQAQAWKLAEESPRELGIRPHAMLARAFKAVDWVRGYKETWQTLGPWERRSVIWSGAILPSDERRAWLGSIKASVDDPVDRAIAIAASKGI